MHGTTSSVSICNSQQTKKDKIIHLSVLNITREHFRNKLAALASDKHSLEDENDVSLEPLPKRLRVSKKSTSAKHQTDYSIRPNYVEHEGQYYHIVEFLSLQEGNVYRPATSRLARWMESARNDFMKKSKSWSTLNELKPVPT